MNQKEWFPITHLHRDDLRRFLGDKADSISDDDMEYIARRIGNAVMDLGYWEALEELAEDYKN